MDMLQIINNEVEEDDDDYEFNLDEELGDEEDLELIDDEE